MQAPTCPKCSGPMFDETLSKFWNNGLTKDGKQKPTWKCKDKANCDGVRWPAKVPVAQRPMPPEPPVWDGPYPEPESDGAMLAFRGAPESAPPAVPAVSQPIDPARARLNAQFKLYDVCLDHAVKSAARYPSASLDIAAMCATLYIAASKVA